MPARSHPGSSASPTTAVSTCSGASAACAGAEDARSRRTWRRPPRARRPAVDHALERLVTRLPPLERAVRPAEGRPRPLARGDADTDGLDDRRRQGGAPPRTGEAAGTPIAHPRRSPRAPPTSHGNMPHASPGRTGTACAPCWQRRAPAGGRLLPGPVAGAPYFDNYERLPRPWTERVTGSSTARRSSWLGPPMSPDGHPSRPSSTRRRPYRIVDFTHCPWVVPAAAVVDSAAMSDVRSRRVDPPPP